MLLYFCLLNSNLCQEKNVVVRSEEERWALLNQGMNDNLAPIQKLVWV
jgi:hypothetical protein